ncbi:ceramide synthase 3 isoform X2 [Ranitomeya variabilis]
MALRTLSDWFWWERIWLPCNYTWDDFQNSEGTGAASTSQLLITLPLALLFTLLRYGFERAIATPVARAMGIKSKVRQKASLNPVLENFYISSSKHPSQTDIYGLVKKSNRTAVQIERWFRKRRNQDRPAVMKKFQESCWRFTFYLCALIGGIAVLHDKPWFHDVWEVWVGYPKQEVLESQYWYYVMELGFYWSLLFSVASDVRRKDFMVQVVHHLATIFLLNFSWGVKYIRVGTLTLLVHDVSDVLLEAAKMCSYAKWSKTCNILFAVFAVVFVISRLIVFPFWIIYATVVYPLYYCPRFFLYYFFNMVMFILQFLHIYWAYLIFRMVRKMISGNMSGDDRSDNEEEDSEENEEQPLSNGDGKKRIINGQHDR